MNTNMILWILAFMAFAVAEALTMNIVSIWFCIGAVCAVAACRAGYGILIQGVVFVVVSAAFLIMTRPFVKHFIKNEFQPTNFDRIIGNNAVVIEDISKGGLGTVKADGKIWTAKAENENEEFLKGTEVTIMSISGVTVCVKKKEV